MSSPNRLLIAAAALLAVSATALAPAPVALADALIYNPYEPGLHPGAPDYYYRYHYYPDWFERRDSVTLQHGNAVHANQAIQMRDPWPPYVGNRNIPFNGIRMDSAVDRYKGAAQ